MSKTTQIEIVASLSGTLPMRSYENLKPFFSVKEVIEVGEKELIDDNDRLARHQALYDQLNVMFNQVREQCKIEEIQAIFSNLRFTDGPDGRKYPHVTDIISWDKDFHITPDQLAQYGVRGTVIHALVDHWRITGKWEPDIMAKKDRIILENGSLRLITTLESIKFLDLMDKHGKEIKFTDGEFQVFNAEDRYCGTPDAIGTHEGDLAVFDFKCREAQEDDFMQMAAYASSDEPRMKGVKKMVLMPLNPKNKSGYGKPVVNTDIEGNYKKFLRYRNDFKDKFGV